MKPAYQVRFHEDGNNMVATIAIPSPTGPVNVTTKVPLLLLKHEVIKAIAANRTTIGADFSVYERIPAITRQVARRRLIRKLHDNVGAWPGGPKTETMHQLAVDIITDARSDKTVKRNVAFRKMKIIRKEARRGDPAALIAFGALKRAYKETRANPTPQGKTAMNHEIGSLKSFGKGLVKAAKSTVKVADSATSSQLGRLLVSNVPGGANALAARDYAKQAAKVIAAAKSGNKPAIDALADIRRRADAGDAQAIEALRRMNAVNKPGTKPSAPAYGASKGKGHYMNGVRLGMRTA